MAYATLDDVQDRMPQFVLSATSKPNATTAQKFLDDVHAEVEAALSNMGYYVPVDENTSPRSHAQLVALEALGAGARVLYARAAGVGGEAGVASADRMQKQYDDMLLAWADPKSPKELTDAVRTSIQRPKPEDLLTSNAAIWATDEEEGRPRLSMNDVW